MDTRLAPRRSIAVGHRVLSINGFIRVDGTGTGDDRLGLRPAGMGVKRAPVPGCWLPSRILQLAG